MKNVMRLSAVLILASMLSSCGYNGMIERRERVTAQWSQVENEYQRRANLVGNIVETVKAAGKYEQETLEKIIQARASATQVKVDPEKLTQEDIDKFQSAQSSLSRLLVTFEQYPDLKAVQGYTDLRNQLTDIENRIAFQIKNYNDLANEYNASIQTFPNVITAKMFGFQPKGYFKAEAGSEVAPKIKL
ncbi:MAG: LemA family protein [Chitinophagales bacterium]